MWPMLIGSPVSGSGIRQSSGKACWRSNMPASVCAAPASAGAPLTSPESVRGYQRSLAMDQDDRF
jgi:hypothetical protein